MGIGGAKVLNVASKVADGVTAGFPSRHGDINGGCTHAANCHLDLVEMGDGVADRDRIFDVNATCRYLVLGIDCLCARGNPHQGQKKHCCQQVRELAVSAATDVVTWAHGSSPSSK